MDSARFVVLGSVAHEVVDRCGQSDTILPVFGVDKAKGLTAEPRYQSKDLSRYKFVRNCCFAYNPMRLNIGSIGFSARGTPVGLVSPDYIVFEFNEDDVIPEFFFLHTLSEAWRNWLSGAGEGSVRERIYFRSLAEYEFMLPSVNQQIFAVETLAPILEKIELNRKMNAALEGVAEAIFSDWFIDFGPTRRKLSGSVDPEEILGKLECAAGDLGEISRMFPSSIGDDDLPEGWIVRPLIETLVLQRGFDLPAPSRIEGRFRIISAGGDNGSHDSFKVEAPGVCTGRSGVIGNVYYVQEDFWPLNTSLWVKEFPHSTPAYAYFVLKSLQLSRFNAGSAVPTLNRNHVHELLIPKPPMELIRAFDEIATAVFRKIAANDAESRTLAEVRDYLLPRLMAGELRGGDLTGGIAA